MTDEQTAHACGLLRARTFVAGLDAPCERCGAAAKFPEPAEQTRRERKGLPLVLCATCLRSRITMV